MDPPIFSTRDDVTAAFRVDPGIFRVDGQDRL
jgi:hypothetical protein